MAPNENLTDRANVIPRGYVGNLVYSLRQLPYRNSPQEVAQFIVEYQGELSELPQKPPLSLSEISFSGDKNSGLYLKFIGVMDTSGKDVLDKFIEDARRRGLIRPFDSPEDFLTAVARYY